MNPTLDRIVNEIVSSYSKIGGINHLEGPNLPSQRSVCLIVRSFIELIFPGYHDDEIIDELNMKYIVGDKVSSLTRKLIEEVVKSISFQERLKGKPDKVNKKDVELLVLEIISTIPEIRKKIKLDVDAAFSGDPAAQSHEEVILSYPCIEVILVHRIAHEFWIRKVPLIPRMMSEFVHSKTGIDIHPGATIGDYFFIDHGTGVVIGETTNIGNHVKLYQGVTLGALSVKKELGSKKRHPTIEDNVTIYAGATILGGETVVGERSIIGGNVWITSSVPAGSRVYYRPDHYIFSKPQEGIPDFQI